MKIHHLNCATICPVVPKALLGNDHVVCHCLLIESPGGLVLVDTGLGTQDLADPIGRMGHAFTKMMRPRLDLQETAVAQVRRLGFKASDVRHIVLTHLDVDHAGGISDFPDAAVHVFESEYEAALARASRIEHLRYHPLQWAHGPRWVRHELAGDRWNAFGAVRALDGKMPEILLVPLLGHTRGHCGIAVNSGTGWLLHAGDAYFHREEMSLPEPHCPVALNAFQIFIQMDGKARLENQHRLRELKLAHGRSIDVFCSHDLVELERLRQEH